MENREIRLKTRVQPQNSRVTKHWDCPAGPSQSQETPPAFQEEELRLLRVSAAWEGVNHSLELLQGALSNAIIGQGSAGNRKYCGKSKNSSGA